MPITNSDHPAFPYITDSKIREGLTKREYFAAAALQGLVSRQVQGNAEDFADYAVAIADATIKRLNA